MISLEKSPFKNNLLEGKRILVTGGGTGLGKSMATLFSLLGAKVAITSRKLDVIKKTADEIQAISGFETMAVACDVREYHQVEAVQNEVYEKWGGIDMLLNNAAGNFISPTERLSHRAFKIIIDIVLHGSINTTLAFGKRWIKEKQKASIINIVTTYAYTGSGYVVPSACAKAGVLAMTRSLAAEWGKYQIRLNGIAPGPFPTKGAWDRLLPGDLAEKFDFAKRIPLGRVGEHQELANLAAFMASDFSTYLNGEIVTLDGGEWMKGAGQFNMLEQVPEPMWDMLEESIRKTKGS